MSRVKIEVLPRENRTGTVYGVRVSVPHYRLVGGFFRKTQKVYTGVYEKSWARYDRNDFPYYASPYGLEFWGTREQAEKLADQLTRIEIPEWNDSAASYY